MRVFIFIITVLASASATRLSSDDIEELFRKHVRQDLTNVESQQFEDVLYMLRRPEYVSLASLERSSQTRTSIDCLVCRSGAATVFESVKNGRTDEEIIETVTNLCYSLGIASYNVCSGVCKLNVPIFTYIIKTTPEATPRSFCGLVLQRADNPNFCRIDDERFEWTVDLPPAATPPNKQSAVTSKPLKIAVITDAHIDPLYEAYGVADCDEPTCCRIGQTSSKHPIPDALIDESTAEQSVRNVNGQMMVDISRVSDIRKVTKFLRVQARQTENPEPAGYWGDYRNCDTPIWAFEDVIDRIAETHKGIDMVYYVGDNIDHHVWETTYDLINKVNQHFIDKMRSSFGDDVLIIPTIGNHEAQPTNQFAPSTVTGEHLNTTWLYDGLAKKWDYYLTEDAKRTLRERGEFSLVVRPGFRVISLNTNVAYKYNWWLTYDPRDAKKHLDWLINELYEAENAGEKVHIITHIPPGVQDLTHTWTREYNRIVNRFTRTIAAQFNGHVHADRFNIFYDTDGKPINVAWNGGSATSYTFKNLNYKIIDVNPTTYELETMVNYVYNLTEANLTPNRRPHWFQLYNMTNSYGLSDLSPESLNNLVHKMVTTNKELLDSYTAFHNKLSDADNCDTDCKLNRLCNAVTTVLWDRQKCEELRGLYYEN